jgi:hypothetical protein
MSYLDSSTAVIEAIITERGKQILAANPQKFKIVKFAVSDDEIDYGLTSAEIQALRIYEPITRENSLQFRNITLPKNSKFVGTLQFSSDEIVVSGTGAQDVVISTINMDDQSGYVVFVDTLDVTIEAVDSISDQSAEVVQQIGSSNTQSLVCKTTFKVTGTNVAGTYYIRVIGVNSGAAKKLRVDVTYVDYSSYL